MMLRTIFTRASILSVLCSAFISGMWMTAQAQDEAALPPLPKSPASWVNSAPLTYEQLRGKAIYLVFFEETCPRCRAAWPDILAAAKANEKLPVVYVAVNSGTPRAEVERYAQQVKITWPMIVDADRSFEKEFASSSVGEISLQNIRQIRGITAAGKIESLAYDEYDMAIKGLATGAVWKVERAEVPPELVPLWQQIEYGSYAGVALPLKKAAMSNRPEVKSVVEKMQAVIDAEKQELESEAVAAAESGNKYKAHETLQKLNDSFKGYPLNEAAAKLKKELPRDAQVKAGIAASKQIQNIERQLANAKPQLKDKLGEQLGKMVTDFPETELAAYAASLMKNAGIEPPVGTGLPAGDQKPPTIKSGTF
ncbi:MAG: hypothetical protein C0478_03715 [Planctomyces sp.]|nr:hypothetical protein [Planctomyces sp.]